MRYFLLLLCLLGSVSASAQKNKAVRLYEQARQKEQMRDFRSAEALMRKATQVDSTYAAPFYALGEYNRVVGRNEEAERYFGRVLQLAPKDPQFLLAHIIMAKRAQITANYAEAEQLAGQFLAFDPEPRMRALIAQAEQILVNAGFAKVAVANPLPYTPEPLPAGVNQLDLQYFPVVSADNELLVFTGRDNGTDEDIFQSVQRNGVWQEAKPIAELNTNKNEGTCALSADGRTLIYTICQPQSQGGYGSCDLYVSYRNGEQWSGSMNLGSQINTPSRETQPSLSADGRVLYFASDRPGGFGKHDIYRAQKREDGSWSKPQNLGKSVNGSGDEISPFIHTNGLSLYFSSESYPGMGGLDVFRSEYEGGRWSSPKNLGYPLNTAEDQISFFVTADRKTGYISEEKRMANSQFARLLSFPMPEDIKPTKSLAYVKGIVTDKETGRPLRAELALRDVSADSLVSDVHSDSVSGSYLITLPQGAQYALFVSAPGYLFSSSAFDYTLQMGQSVEQNIALEPIKVGSAVRLNNIFFATDSYELENKSRTELNRVVSFMNKNPEVKIVLAGHTDNVGGEGYNQQLSQQRADAVKSFLLNAGVAANRLRAKGYGETQPEASNETEEGRAQNRRIEFEIDG